MPDPFNSIAAFFQEHSMTGHIDQKPYCFTDTVVCVGAPLVTLEGLDSIKVRFLHPQTVYKANIGGGGSFIRNRNNSAEIELTFLQGSYSIPLLEIFEMTNIDIPIAITDLASIGTSSIVASKCRIVDIGDWQRQKEAENVTIKIIASQCAIYHGMRSPVIER